MSTPLSVQMQSRSPIALCKSNPRVVAKHAAACKKADKAFLREIYGYQPRKGNEIGVILSAVASGSVIAVEIRFFIWARTYVGMFELPIHTFSEYGKPLTSSNDIGNFVHRFVNVVVSDRYEFNGILLSKVDAIDLQHTIDIANINPQWALIDVVLK